MEVKNSWKILLSKTKVETKYWNIAKTKVMCFDDGLLDFDTI